MKRHFGICLSCSEEKVLSEEHIIPQALGGKLKAYIYCKECNDMFGATIDSELISKLGYYGISLNIKREKGKHKPFDVTDIDRGIELRFDGKSFMRKNPIVKIERNGNKITHVDVTARTEKELKTIVSKITEKHKLTGETKTFLEEHHGPSETVIDLVFDNSKIRRSVAKIAYGLLCTKIPSNQLLSNSFDNIRNYIRFGSGKDLATANFINTKFMSDYIRPNHKIHIVINRPYNLAYAFVCIFGTFKYTVLLSDSYKSIIEWPGIDYTYNPVTQKVIMGNIGFKAPMLNIKQILSPGHTRYIVQESLENGHKILENYIEGMQFLKIEEDK